METVPSTRVEPLRFPDFPNFTPMYTPKECLELGVFGGNAFRTSDRRLQLHKANFFKDIPPSKWGNIIPNYANDFFGVEVKERNRITQLNMPIPLRSLHNSWFQWYAEFYMGFRTQADSYRITQWASELNTFFFYIAKGELNDGLSEEQRLADLSIESLKPWRQNCLNFAWDPTKWPWTYGIKSPF